MKTLLKNGNVINVFTGEIQKSSVLLDGTRIVGVGDYLNEDADHVEDVLGRYICPGFIDGHIHIESTMLSPKEFARVCVPHGTTSVVADPHEIANVCGSAGIQYILQASDGLPMTVYVVLPSCVPATGFCESGAVLDSKELEPFYEHPRVLGLGEVMNYMGVIQNEPDLLAKITDAQQRRLTVNGHAPLLSGKMLDAYLSAGIRDDHECTSVEEAKERIRKGQWIMIRQGTAARNLQSLLPLFEEPWAHRCILVTDDKHPADLLRAGHIDQMIRLAVQAGKDPVIGIRMATIQAAECFGMRQVGAIAPGYQADIVVLSDLEQVSVEAVYCKGVLVSRKGRLMNEAQEPRILEAIESAVRQSFQMKTLTERDFQIDFGGERKCRVIRLVKDEILTEEWITDVDFSHENGVDTERDIVKIAVVERHHHTGHRGLGLIAGTGLQCGAIASSVSHDSHNLILIGVNDKDMAFAGNRVREMGGGCVVVKDGAILSEMPLPIAGLMWDTPAEEVAKRNQELRESVHLLGVPPEIEPFMSMAFVSLPVIPHLKLTTKGLVDVNAQEIVPLFAD